MRHHHERERRVEHPRGELAEEVDVELVAAGHEQLVPADEQSVPGQHERERGPGQAVMDGDEEDDGGVDHQPVGERVGDLAELRLDMPAAREPAVHLVGDAGDRRRSPQASCTPRRPG